MIRRDRVKANLQVLGEALDDLERYRTSTTREQYDNNRDARLLVGYALLRALTAALDIGKEWAPPRRVGTEGPPKYEDGLWSMQKDGLDATLASRLRDSIQIRNDLAHCNDSLDHEKVFDVFQGAGFLQEFAEVIGRFLNDPLADIQVGNTVAGVVTSFTGNGAVVDLDGGLRGFIHISQMSTDWLNRPSDVLDEGEEVQVRVCHFDPDTEDISLALDPRRVNLWVTVEERYGVGEHVRGRVVGIDDWGVRVSLEPGVQGYVSVTDISSDGSQWRRPADLVRHGQEVEAVVLEVNAAARHMRLGMKQLAQEANENLTTGSVGAPRHEEEQP